MVKGRLQIDEEASNHAARIRGMLHGWSLVAAELQPRTPEIDRELSTAAGQAALIMRVLLVSPDVTAAPEGAADCGEEILTTMGHVANYLATK